jgi:hypothetical protein
MRRSYPVWFRLGRVRVSNRGNILGRLRVLPPYEPIWYLTRGSYS